MTTKLSDKFLCIPKLNVSSSNWVLYKERFFWALEACAILDLINGTGEEPVNPIAEDVRAKGVLTEDSGTIKVSCGVEEIIQGVEAGRSCCKTTDCQLHPGLTIYEDSSQHDHI